MAVCPPGQTVPPRRRTQEIKQCNTVEKSHCSKLNRQINCSPTNTRNQTMRLQLFTHRQTFQTASISQEWVVFKMFNCCSAADKNAPLCTATSFPTELESFQEDISADNSATHTLAQTTLLRTCKETQTTQLPSSLSSQQADD